MNDFDVIVVGAGHAGCEAAAAAARMGRRVACVTLNLKHVGRLSCNPAIGGLAKGQLVRELDALGGVMAKIADASCIQFRRLNTRKGLAVQSSRCQVDIDLYPKLMRAHLEAIDGLELIGGEVAGIRTEGGRVSGISLGDGTVLQAKAVVLTTGTFLSGILHCGEKKEVGGRIGDGAAHQLARSLNELGLRLGRLKTGTVPRLDSATVDWANIPVQDDTVPAGRFSFTEVERLLPQVDCHITHTNERVHDIIRGSLDRSPLFSGEITGTGPRYCPSIEDKVVRFPDRSSHLLFLEPEGLSTRRVYANGLSTSLPADVQEEMVRAIKGLEKAKILQHGYAVEYDFADPRDLGHDLQHKQVPGLYLAGQVNGTSGYEEAAVQGFVAGVSAAQDDVFHVERSEAYIGVLIDDLVSRGVGGEPYRMFTSRAEHRLLLREDNADRRLIGRGRALGLIDDARWEGHQRYQQRIEEAHASLEQRVIPSREMAQKLETSGIGGLKKPVQARDLLRRPHVDWTRLGTVVSLPTLEPRAAEQVEIDTKYSGYVERAERRAESAKKMQTVSIPNQMDWRALDSLSWEVRERLSEAQPKNLGQLSRIPGVTPAAVNVVAAWLSRHRRQAAS
jgi:tRNA uridine 5-carboxymethylaminomethyl modification enzyme